MHKQVARGLAVAAASILAAIAFGTPAAAIPVERVTTKAVFNTAGGGTEIKDEFIKLIDGAAPDSTIRTAAFHVRDQDIVDRLIAAADRGVQVHVVADSGAAEDAPHQELEEAIGTDTSASSWVKRCEEDNACIGDRPGKAVMHSKFFLFSDTINTSNVAVLTSANLSDTVGGTAGWNSAYVDVGNPELYTRLDAYFNTLASGNKDDNYYDSNPPDVTENVKTYFHPRRQDDQDDTYVNILDGVDCDASETTISISNWWLGRQAVADKLSELRRQGCEVELVVNYISDEECETLADTSFYAPVRIYGFSEDTRGEGTHQKDMTIDGNYLGEDTKVTFTGSHNLVPSSLDENDEITARVYGDEIHDQFAANFDRVKDAADVTVNPLEPDSGCEQLDPHPEEQELERGTRDLERGTRV